MRTIKFRALAQAMVGGKAVRGVWVYGFYYETHERPGRTECWITDEKGAVSLVYPESRGEWTGLLDANNKEIYEGDVVRCFGGESYRATIVWNHGGFEMKWHKQNIRTADGMQEPMITNIHIDSEIIDNIYENPDLLSNP